MRSPFSSRSLTLAALLFALPIGACAPAPESVVPAVHPVEDVFRTGIAAFNRHDLDTFMGQWDADIEMYTPTGWLRGGDAVRARFVETFRDFPNVRMEIEDLRVRAITPDVATVDFRWATFPMGNGPAYRGVGSGVYVRRGARWVEVLEHESIVSIDAELQRRP